jgi:hypothetical protein
MHTKTEVPRGKQAPWDDELDIATDNRALNPWFSIWTKPRATIRQIIETDEERMVVFLAAVGGFSTALSLFPLVGSEKNIDCTGIITLCLVFGSFFGVVWLYIFGALIVWTGRWLGGSCPVEHIRCALAWSNVPSLWTLLLLIPGLALFGKALFSAEPPTLISDPTLLCLYWGFGVIGLVVCVWEFIILLKCLGEVQGFSAWRALGNLALVGMVLILGLNVVDLLIVLASKV